jgi:hypothetical protein
MDTILALAIFAGAAATFFFLKSAENDVSKEIELMEHPADHHADDEGVVMIVSLLKKNKALRRHKIVVDSMSLLLQPEEDRHTLNALVIDEDRDIVEIGRNYIEKFVLNPTKLTCFLAGVIEREYDLIRTKSSVCVQDVIQIRRILDSFYYKLGPARTSRVV